MSDMSQVITRIEEARAKIREAFDGVALNKLWLGLELRDVVALVGERNLKHWAEINIPSVEWELIQEVLTLARAHETARGKQIKEVING